MSTFFCILFWLIVISITIIDIYGIIVIVKMFQEDFKEERDQKEILGNISSEVEIIKIPIPTPFSPGLIERKLINGKIVSETVTHLLPHGGYSVRDLKG